MALLTPAAAAGSEICVTGPDVATPSGCDSTHAGFAAAVTAADANPGPDRVRIGAGTVHWSGVTADPGDDADDDVEIVGAGRDATILEVNGRGSQLLFATDHTVVRDLEVRFTTSDFEMIGLELHAGLVENVDVTGPAGQEGRGIMVRGGADVRHVDVQLLATPFVYPLYVDGSAGGPTEIEDASARGEIGIIIVTPRRVVVRRAAFVASDAGVLVSGGADVLLDTFTSSGAALDEYATPVLIKNSPLMSVEDADVTIRHGSLLLTEGPAPVVVRQMLGATTNVHLRSTVLDPPAIFVQNGSPGGGDRVNIDSEYTSLDPTRVHHDTSSGATTTFTAGPGTAPIANPDFADPDDGDLRIGPGSGLIDRGEPVDAILGAAALDLLGRRRVDDGDDDGDARRDIGAYEVPDPTPPAEPVVVDDDQASLRSDDPPLLRGDPLPSGGGGSAGTSIALPPSMTVATDGLVDRRGRVALTLRCPDAVAGVCRGEVVLRGAGLRLGRASFGALPSARRVVRVKIGRRGLRALRRTGSVRVRAAVTATGTWPTTKTFTLRRSRRR
jgi:hypothetical protein